MADVKKNETAAKAVAETAEKAPKEAVKKAAAKVAAKKTAAKKTTTKKEDTVTFFVEFAGNQMNYTEIVEKAKNAALVQSGKKAASTIKDIAVYVKPEENAVYYVANGKIAGRVDLF